MIYKEIRFAGDGGQGVILASIILAEVAVNSGYNVVQTQSYGPEARGGACRAELIISSEDIDFPKVQFPDITLLLSQTAAEKYLVDKSSTGIIVLDDKINIKSYQSLNTTS